MVPTKTAAASRQNRTDGLISASDPVSGGYAAALVERPGGTGARTAISGIEVAVAADARDRLHAKLFACIIAAGRRAPGEILRAPGIGIGRLRGRRLACSAQHARTHAHGQQP